MLQEYYNLKAVNREIMNLSINYDDWFHRAPTKLKKYRKRDEHSNHQPKKKRK